MCIHRNIAASVAVSIILLTVSKVCGAEGAEAAPVTGFNSNREAYFGELHLHTSYSFDAYLMGMTAVDPDKAYRFASGEPVEFFGESAQRSVPLDFMAVTDHSELIGIFSRLSDDNSEISRTELGKEMKAHTSSLLGSDGRPKNKSAFEIGGGISASLRSAIRNWLPREQALPDNLRAESLSAWQREIEFANRHNQPGKFTTFIAYEWTAHSTGGAVLHRNVIFKGDSAPAPFTARDSQRPEDLWAWLRRMRTAGYEALAVPHNGNLSSGLMFDWVDSDVKPISQSYAEERQANEPLAEISQTKGASETHPLLAPSDEFANYEIMERKVDASPYRPGGSYLRDALGRGLILQRNLAVNPYKYGFVGGSDLHTGLSVSAQADYSGGHTGTNLGGNKPTAGDAAVILGKAGERRSEAVSRMHTAGSLTGVWAESNTRESIYNALRRKETFATTGTRLKLRFFGGWNFGNETLKQEDWISRAYAQGTPMGGDFPTRPAQAKTPTFAIWAVKDPSSGNLDRMQVIKVWEERGHQRERIFDVAWSGNRPSKSANGRLSPVGDTVNLRTGRYTNDIGAVELKAVWRDPEFNPNSSAAYYLRVLEIPTPRWSTLLAIQASVDLPDDTPATIQQRGWSSPIWYVPP